MQRETRTLGSCSFEILSDGNWFEGLGAIHIGATQVRSSRLPLRPFTQSFSGHELHALRLLDIEERDGALTLNLEAEFRAMNTKLLRDHSFDPIHDTGDWDEPPISGVAMLSLVLRPARDSFGGEDFSGFSYHYDYVSDSVPIFYLLDLASWELDGDIAGASVISQSSCSAPTANFAPETAWTTEGLIHWDDSPSRSNPVMTHNLPRWASHQAFDFQYKGAATLLGIYERVDLIRSLLKREPHKAELKTFDKHLFDQTLAYTTSPKKILLNAETKTETAQKNIWTWVFDSVANRARAEFGLTEEPMIPRLSHNYWDNFTIDDYLKDLVPAAANLGFKALFVDNLNKSAATERCPHPDFHWNMCCPHEYEPAPRLGGPERLRNFVNECAKHGITPFAWTNNAQALSSPLNAAERDDKGWFVRLEDTRLKYGGAYTSVFSILDFKKDAPRNHWRDALKKIRETTGLSGYLFDSFYNLGFMPINYHGAKPSTQWRELLRVFKELQDSGIHFLIESFGPFGSPQHGCPTQYAEPQNIFACYKLTCALGYTTIPSRDPLQIEQDAARLYRFFAHMASPSFALFQNGVRIDATWTERHKQVLAEYYAQRPFMQRRFLQEDDAGVLWHDGDRTRATLWNFSERHASLPGIVRDLTNGETLPLAKTYHLEACHTYAISSTDLPVAVSGI
jgi:hypothetical protein